jgi:hypothetical protein
MGWYKIAWGFLKPVGANGVRNVNRKLRLQLYKPEALKKADLENGPEVCCLFLCSLDLIFEEDLAFGIWHLVEASSLRLVKL